MIMLFKGNSSRLEHLIEKIQANKENHDVSPDDLKGTIPTLCFILLSFSRFLDFLYLPFFSL